MTLIIEPVSGGDVLANSAVTVEEADAYFGDQGNFDWDASADKEAALIRATAYVDARYALRWLGTRTLGRAQGLAWPRTGAVDNDGVTVPDDLIPMEYKRAVIVAALMFSMGKLDMTVSTEAGVFVTSEQLGPLKTTYEQIGGGGTGTIFPDILDNMLASLIKVRGAARTFMRA